MGTVKRNQTADVSDCQVDPPLDQMPYQGHTAV